MPNRKWFNVAGPCKGDLHYMLPSGVRLPHLKALIAQQLYFVIHAPRQTGKTTAMIALAQELTASGDYTAIMLSLEVGAVFSDRPAIAEQAILGEWTQAAQFYLPPELQPPPWPQASEGLKISTALSTWSQVSPRPLVVFLDEIDSLSGDTLISILRQLRSGYPRRPQGFPQSLGLIGMRDVRDYKLAAGGSDRLHTASPFNIKADSFTLSNFTKAEVQALYQQHTDAKGQVFTPAAIDRVYYLTNGQPWLVNAIARQATEVLAPDFATPIEVETINQAKEILIQRQDTHLDSLAERLREERVRSIIEPMLAGQEVGNIPDDDLRYVFDLGLCRDAGHQGVIIANPIYQEVFPRVLCRTTAVSLGQITPVWLTDSGELDTTQLLASFLAFWRQHGEPLFRSTPYPEIAPHLVLMAFLHRVVNGGGTLEREYAIGSGRMDLCLRYGAVTLAMELKVWRSGQKDPLEEGLVQLERYLAGLGLETGWLVIFDRRENLPPLSDRTTTETATTPSGKAITVIR
ncbi:MAG: ATP-binding protein, partial [Prochlorothrix sp.]